MQKKRTGFFLKLNYYDHIKNLLEEGIVFLNTLRRFGEIENESLRDHTEHTLFRRYSDGVLEIKNPLGEKVSLTSNNVAFKYTIKGNAFCLYAITEDLCEKSDSVDISIAGDYDAFLIILDTEEFIQRVVTALVAKGFDPDYRFIEYKDPSDESIFHKSTIHSAENEYRFVVINDKDVPETIQIGSIEDIAIMFPIERLKSLRFMREGSKITINC